MQQKFNLKKMKSTFGGSHLKSSPKVSRPIDTKSAMHLTLKASKGVLRLPRTHRAVDQIVERTCRRYAFTLYRYSNNFNHLHIVMRVTNRHRWRQFIRELTVRIASEIKIDGKLWLGRPFTRIINGWGRNFRNVCEYVELNIIEASRGLSREQAKALRNLRVRYG